MGEGEEAGPGSLYRAEGSRGRAAYKMYASTVLVGILLILVYRATYVPVEGRLAWLALFGAELWFGCYWIITQSARWNPTRYHTNKDKLSQRFGSQLPRVDIFVCTSDPVAEPPSLVMSTVLSLMAYDYEPEKISVYLSDDAGSILTFYALWEVSHFAKHWLPYCRKFKPEPRSPAAYFSNSSTDHGIFYLDEWASMKKMFEDMRQRIDRAVAMGRIPEEALKEHAGFSKWNSAMTPRHHPSIVQILIDGGDQNSTDLDGTPLPSVIYMAREKHPQHHHNFKAGAMNALIRVSSEISNAPIILNVDCDMYSNNSGSVRDALCFFLDERGRDVAFVQYPQYFENITKNDLYANSLNVVNEIELSGMNNWGGPMYIGTGCFHKRGSLCGRKYSKDYDWVREGADRKSQENICTLEERAESLITCTYESNTPWGKEVGLKYGCSVEDVLTGLAIHCRGWRSVCYNPARRGFLGHAPTSLEQMLVQYKRWGEGNLQIFLSSHCPFIQGHGKMKLGHQMAYSVYGLWASNSLPTLAYLLVPPFFLLKAIPLYPHVSSPWFVPFAYVFVSTRAYSLQESIRCGETVVGWWNSQRMLVLKRITAYLYSARDTVLRLLGLSKLSFAVTPKVSDGGVSKRYEQEVMEFGSSSSMFTIIATVALFNLGCLVGGLKRVLEVEGVVKGLLAQFLLCVMVVGINVPVYGAMFFRTDQGSMARSTTFASFVLAAMACLVALI